MGTRHDRTHGILLAGVHHWDERSLDSVVPRCLMPVGLSPLVGYILRWFADGETPNVTLCANSASRVARICLGDGAAFDTNLDYYEDFSPRGPAGCVHDVAEQVDADRFIVADANHLPRFDLRKLVETHVASRAGMTVVLTSHCSDDNKNDTNLRPAGVYVIERRVLDAIGDRGYQDIKEEMIPALRRRGEAVLPYIIHDRVFRVTGLLGYLMAHEFIVRQLVAGEMIGRDFERFGGSLVHKTADISSTARLIGPCVVGPRARLEAGVVLVGPTVVGEGCRVGHDAVISRSALWTDCDLGHGTRLDSSVLTYGAALRPGTELISTLIAEGRSYWKPKPHQQLWSRRPATRQRSTEVVERLSASV